MRLPSATSVFLSLQEGRTLHSHYDDLHLDTSERCGEE